MASLPPSNDAMTPMLRQYLRIKAENPEAILMFRLGDFYEMFFNDAEIASKILSITLTSRNRNDPNPVPLCGIPHHSVEPYLARLLEAGKKVAICDQVEDPRLAKGIVKREVTRVLTPGVVPDGLGLDGASHNFLAAVCAHDGGIGMALTDVSTGIFQAGQCATWGELFETLGRMEPRELLVPAELAGEEGFLSALRRALPAVALTSGSAEGFEPSAIVHLAGGEALAATSPAAARAAAGALDYLARMQKGKISHIRGVVPFGGDRSMRLDEATKRHLELVRTIQEGERKGSLLEAIDRTSTAPGARKLRGWLLAPLVDPEEINARLDAVEGILSETALLRRLPETLAGVHDLERITSRAAMGLAHARDIVALGDSLEAARRLKKSLAGQTGLVRLLADAIDPHEFLVSEIRRCLVESPPLALREGGLIREGVSAELDEIREIIAHGKDFIARLEAKEREATGIGSLKIRYNKVFGYYLEVTNAHRERVPPYYLRKQTLANAERFITPELKEMEERILGAKERGCQLELQLFEELSAKVGGSSASLLSTADAVASIDALLSLARVAAEHDYCRPEVTNGAVIEIREGRHPIVERSLALERFVPNDILLDGGESRLLMITGPNMAGKSTAMRQTALICLMAQIGSFVPAREARIGVVDRIFTRVGASDALSQGQSTFMVEMAEAALILKEATARSLVVIDEIGRGTSTFDGLAIAWAVAEDLHDRVRARTLFATHYHELTDLALTKPGIRNMHIAVKEWNGEVIFLRRLLPGATSRSYGIQVAKLAGLPPAVIERAGEVLENLESGELDEVGMPRCARAHGKAPEGKGAPAQYQLFAPPISDEIAKRLRAIDPDSLTPMQALSFLHELKKL